MRRYNIYHRRDGRWEGRISRGKEKNGKRRYQYVFAPSRELAERRIDAIRAGAQRAAVCSLTVNRLLAEWLCQIRHTIKDSTAANCQMKAYRHILPYFGEMAASSVQPADISAFIAQKQDEGLSNRYISDIIVLLKSVFKYIVRTYHISNPLDGVAMPKKAKPAVRLLDEEEQMQLRSYLAGHPSRSAAGTALSLSTGIRLGELCALRGADIDLQKRILTVSKTIQRIQCHGGDTKTKLIVTAPKSESSRREVPIPACMLPLLEQFRCAPDGYLLSGTTQPVEPRTMQYRFRRLLHNAKLPSVHFHALRHMFATSCVKLGFDIKSLSEILGHSSVEITLNRYVLSSFERKQAFMDRISFST